ncbi:MAG: carboxy terminal-processing peptidase [Verrucomicrobiota bacterium]|jgi:carboxyl-terminal processing protease
MKASFFYGGLMALGLAACSPSVRAQDSAPAFNEAPGAVPRPRTDRTDLLDQDLLDKSPATNGAAARPTTPPPAAPSLRVQTEEPVLSGDEMDARIAAWTANAVQAFQYSQHPFDAEISGRFLDRYLESLDYNHVFFLQSDLNQFDTYRSNLQVYTLRKHDISPAFVIFSRFLERAGEREAYESNLVATEHFDFAGQERFTPERQRHDLPNPKDLAEATNLWREEVRFDYLDEKLAQKLEYKGPVAFEGQSNLTVSLTRKTTNWSSFQFLPNKFEDERGREFGSLEVSPNGTNATVQLRIAPAGNLLKMTNHFFGGDGKELGEIRFERTPETNNGAAARTDASAKKFDCIIESKEKDTAKLVSSLQKRYAQLLKNYNELTNDGHVLEIYLTALARAYDPHSDYFGRAEAENFKIRMQLSLIGIGAKLMQTDADRCKIDSLIPGGPAEQSGQLTNNDIIVAVAQEDQEPVEVDGKPLQEVVDMIRGPEGTPVTLTIEPAHPRDPSVRQKVVTLIRNKVKLVEEESKAWMFESPAKIGVINVPSFYAETDSDDPASGPPHEHKTVTTDVAALVNRLKKEKVGGIILDLRANGGGYLDEAIKLTGLFTGRGPVVMTKSPDGEILTDNATNSAPLYDGPLIVLTSRLSASASEILAGALQDYGRAIIVGDKTTFGKGTVQTVQPLSAFIPGRRPDTSPNLGSLHLTIKKFYRASGFTTESNGVAADIVLPSILTYANLSESSQPNWLPADTIGSADLPPNLNLVKPYLPELTERSLERRAASKDFAYLDEDIAEYRKSQDDKSMSMNEAARLKEQQDRDARMEARKIERAARPKADEKFYDLTLKDVDKPELTPHKVAEKPASNEDAGPTDSDADSEDPMLSDPI